MTPTTGAGLRSSPLAGLIVHVGLGQAGSTTLQRHVFNRPDFGFALLTPFEKRHHTIRKYVELCLPGEFDAQACRRFFLDQLAAFGDAGLVPVISNEGLTGQNFLQMDRNLETELYARQLFDAFGACRIVLIIREQNELMLSKYRKYLESFEGTASLKDFLRRKPHGQRVAIDADSMYLGLFRYDKLFDLYAQVFGGERVLVLPLEMMAADPASFTARLNAFCGSRIPEDFRYPRDNQNGVAAPSCYYRTYNRIYSPNSLSALWFLNPRQARGRAWIRENTAVGRLSTRLRAAVPRLLAGTSFMDRIIAREKARQREEIRRLVGGFFAGSNARLSELIGLDLARYGYATRDVAPRQACRAAAAPAGLGVAAPESGRRASP